LHTHEDEIRIYFIIIIIILEQKCTLCGSRVFEFYFSIVDCRFANQVLLFQDVLTFQNAIASCYNDQSMALKSHKPCPKMWVVCELIMKVLSLIVFCYVLNQGHGH